MYFLCYDCCIVSTELGLSHTSILNVDFFLNVLHSLTADGSCFDLLNMKLKKRNFEILLFCGLFPICVNAFSVTSECVSNEFSTKMAVSTDLC